MKIQPIDFYLPEEPPPAAKTVFMLRFKRLFERQYPNVLKIPPRAPDNPIGACNSRKDDRSDEFEPSSACLARMVQNFIEESGEKPQQWCNQKRCNCFNGNCTDSKSDDETDSLNASSSEACDLLKSLVPCLCVSERNLLADTAGIIDRNKIGKRKDELSRKIVRDGLISLGYIASICKSKWEKSQAIPSGEYEYIDVVIEGQRYIIDIEFRSEFEVARATKAYKAILSTLPSIFVGQSDRLEKIISIVTKAARQSLSKKGMPFPPWRKTDYVKAKWLSPFTKSLTTLTSTNPENGLVFGKGEIKTPPPVGKGVFVLRSCEGDGIVGSDVRGKGFEEGSEDCDWFGFCDSRLSH